MSTFQLYLTLGLQHIADFKGYDHILFIIVLCAVYQLRHWRKILILITAFTIGHSFSLVLATFNLVRISADWVEFLIPITILLTAFGNILQRRESYSSGHHRYKYAMALFFGLIHGMGFSNYLRALLSDEDSILGPLFSFNLGIELGQIIIVSGFILAGIIIINGLKAKPREWNLVISGAGVGISLILIFERLPFNMKNCIAKRLMAVSFFILLGQLVFAQTRERNLLDTTKIRAALEVIGLDFTGDEISQMARGVSQSKSSYSAIREFAVDNSVSPSLIFNPLPGEFTVPDPNPVNDWHLPKFIELPGNKTDIAFLSIPELAYLIKNRKISSLELTTIYLDRLKAFSDSLYCVVNLTEELALLTARKMDQELAEGKYRGPLHGIPYGVKDLIAVKAYPTTWGAMPFKDQMINENSAVIQKLEEAGAVLIAKLSNGALAMGDVWFGGTTRNPWNTEDGSSGSSAGPAAATSAGLVAFSIGTETLGSIVSPSTRCGVTGLRPTYGRVSKYGTMALSWSMDKIGPICRNAIDCAIVLDYIRGSDKRDPSTLDGGFTYPESINFKKLRIGYLDELFNKKYFFHDNDSVALNLIRKLGAELIPVTLPDNFPINALRIILSAEAAAAFDQLTLSNLDTLLVNQGSWAWPNTFRTSRLIPAVEYIQANRIRSLLIEKMQIIMQDYDLIIAPTSGGNQLTLTNLTGHPSLLLPTGFDKEANPTSITLIGPLFSEGILCAFGELYQKNASHHQQRPPKFNKDNF